MGLYTCIIIDDQEIDRLTVLSYIRKFPDLQVAGVYGSASEALPHIDDADVLFLDIDMPGLSGLELRKTLPGVPALSLIHI